MADHIRYGQDYLLKNTTLGIPALVQTEGIHGLLAVNATIFNSPIAHGSSWNRKVYIYIYIYSLFSAIVSKGDMWIDMVRYS